MHVRDGADGHVWADAGLFIAAAVFFFCSATRAYTTPSSTTGTLSPTTSASVTTARHG